MIKHIFCDLDGTLYHGAIDESDAKAIQEIEEKGVKFHIATGRIFRQAYNMTKDKIDMNGYYICENGAFIHDTDHKQIFSGTIDDNIVKKVIARFESDYAHIYFKHDGGVVLTGGKEVFRVLTDDYVIDPDFVNRESFDNLVGNIGVVSDNIEELGRIELYLKSEFSEVLDVYFSSEKTLNLVAKGVSKRDGIRFVCDILDVKEDEIATIGDSPNDISMLRGLKYSFAMDNANTCVKDHASFVEKSVKDVIEKIKEINNSL